MFDYGEILEFLAKHPPQMDEEREVHASLLELMAQCLRSGRKGGKGDKLNGLPQLENGPVSLSQQRSAN